MIDQQQPAAVNSSTSSAASTPATGKIAFTSRRDGTDHVYVMNADGSTLNSLLAIVPDNYLQWSPDGTKIVFERSQNGIAIYTMNADGSNQKRLSGDASHDTKPSWSPDGTKIVYTWIVGPPANGQLPQTEIRVNERRWHRSSDTACK